MTTPYTAVILCRCCGDSLRGCCKPGRLHPGYCCECDGHTHTEPPLKADTISPNPAYL